MNLLNSRLFAFVCSALILCALVNCNRLSGPASDIVGTWHSPSGASLELTSSGQWIFRNGPMQMKLAYTVLQAEGNTVVVQVQVPNNPNDRANVTLTVSGNTLTTSNSRAWNGTWTR
jgi:hypothetical protein